MTAERGIAIKRGGGAQWHASIVDQTFADAILDRLVHNAYKFKLKGESLRKTKAKSIQADHPAA